MSSRILLSAIIAFAVFGSSVESQARQYSRGYRPKARYNYSQVPHRYGRTYTFREGVGGHRYGDQLTSPFASGSSYNYPGHYNNQTFWERVQTQAGYPVQY
jgi:hypothetical protein